jgi:hypothetical protein
MRDCRAGREIIVIWAMGGTDGFDIACFKASRHHRETD